MLDCVTCCSVSCVSDGHVFRRGTIHAGEGKCYQKCFAMSAPDSWQNTNMICGFRPYHLRIDSMIDGMIDGFIYFSLEQDFQSIYTKPVLGFVHHLHPKIQPPHCWHSGLVSSLLWRLLCALHDI